MEKKNDETINPKNILDYIEDEELNKDIYELNLARKKLKKRLNELKSENSNKIDNNYQNKQTPHDIHDNINNQQKTEDSEKENRFNILNNRFREFTHYLQFSNRFKDAFDQDSNIDPGRLLALTDGIFGMVMTLLAFGIKLPDFQMKSSHDIILFMYSIIPSIGTVLVSFILVGTFWVYHHEIIKIKNMNVTYLWINILFLASISFMPFTTSLLTEYGGYFIAELVFTSNIFIIVLLSLISVYYGYTKRFLDVVDLEERRYHTNTFFIMVLLTIIIILGDYFISPNFTYLYIITPIIFIFTNHVTNQKNINTKS
ncbi:hypothetical protein BGI41_03870 [Methanobrevibacter sp. 87.7]|uniref:TMEM175 family protein n=1 Tax=Methanobrevibacter sp. 87.7 TaxID=387957 RepID=UPI000B500256|nr:TMEM175 family protein [Methanobrevibacter sp. 87.7]OWT33157.1 hypothetical protein BGI41_03870 [Methanobrevibacter sp. 87.7]